MLCLTVCAAPVLAANDEYTTGVFVPSADSYVNVSYGEQSANLLEGYFPASFEASGDGVNESQRAFNVLGSFYEFSEICQPTYSIPDMYIEMLFSVPSPVSVTVSAVAPYPFAAVSCGLSSMREGISNPNRTIGAASQIYSVYDSQYLECQQAGGIYFEVPQASYSVEHYFGFKFVFPATSTEMSAQSKLWGMMLSTEFVGRYDFSAVVPETPETNVVDDIFNQVTINTGLLQDINGQLTEIQTSTVTIQNDVSEIKDGLQDSNSSIWGAFKDSLSGLFVPSADDLTGVKDGFDQLAQDKLGGAYQTVDMVSGGVQSVSDKFKNPGSSPGVEFPGISVPLGGDVGTVTLAASQTVTIPEQMTEVLYPVAGIIIPIVCTIWTVRLGLDMVNCFMSGMSYGDFLHRHTDEEDNEV